MDFIDGAEEIILTCEDSMEGVFSAIYAAYSRRLEHEKTRIQAGEEDNLRLFASYDAVATNEEHAVKVARTLQRELGGEDYTSICMALAAKDVEKAQAVYRTVVLGLRMKKEGYRNRIMEHLSSPFVRKVMELARRTGNESHFLMGFLRFQEMEKGFLFARIGPKNDILAMLTPHFADRLPMENFMIFDETHRMAALHPAGGEWYLVRDFEEAIEEAGLQYSKEERHYQELFHFFCHNISIKERKNQKLQRNMLPLYFRKFMTEFTS